MSLKVKKRVRNESQVRSKAKRNFEAMANDSDQILVKNKENDKTECIKLKECKNWK